MNFGCRTQLENVPGSATQQLTFNAGKEWKRVDFGCITQFSETNRVQQPNNRPLTQENSRNRMYFGCITQLEHLPGSAT